MLKPLIDKFKEELSGEFARNLVSELARFHRIQASPGFRAAAEYCVEELHRFGLRAELLSFPAHEEASYWGNPVPEEWDAEKGELWLIAPKFLRLADYRESKISLIQRSGATEIKCELLVLNDGEEPKEYQGLNLKGKAVLTRGNLSRVHDLAVNRAGASGIIYDGMREIPGVRDRLSLSDARQYLSFWWRPGDRRCFGFTIPPRLGEELRQLSKDSRLRIWARVDSRFYSGALEVVEAFIPGETSEEVLGIAHLCHPQPSANDNGSGAGCLLEVARAIHSLIQHKKLPPPHRGIRFLWVPELTGTFAWLATHEELIPMLRAGLNLDMVGQDQLQCGSSLLIERPPRSLESFAPDLLERIRNEISEEISTHAGIGGYPGFRSATTPFSAGSDHYILSDPRVGIPCPMLIQWPDRYYHTNLDAIEKVDPRMLYRVGVMAATYLYFLANARGPEADWLGYEVFLRSRIELMELAQSLRNKGVVDERYWFVLERRLTALDSLNRLGIEPALLSSLKQRLEGFAREEVKGMKEEKGEGGKRGSIPTRILPGPISLSNHLHRLNPKERDQVHKLQKEHKKGFDILPILALYWADGKRTISEIARLTEFETGISDEPLIEEYFKLLARLGLVELR